jgi:hypothetical protein
MRHFGDVIKKYANLSRQKPVFEAPPEGTSEIIPDFKRSQLSRAVPSGAEG